jgi:anhydro-N-acetylmuramic acid kinase
VNPERSRLLLGLSSGTSADGLDLALLRVQGQGLERQVEFLRGDMLPLARTTREAVHGAAEWSLADVAYWHAQLAEEFASLAGRFLQSSGVVASQLAAVGSHGQTVFHHDGDPGHGTLQLGDASILAARLGAPVVADFRWSDLALGGQGAPISPFADWVLHHDAAPQLVILNLGGIANLTLLEGQQPPRAWDSGPANGPLDALIQQNRPGQGHEDDGRLAGQGQDYDVDGRVASQGQVLGDLLRSLQADDYFLRSLPRSTGLERFGRPLLPKLQKLAPGASLADLLRTCAAWAAWAVAESLASALKVPVEQISLPIYLCGGGARNPVLVQELRQALPQADWQDYRKLNGNPDLREAAAFALLADAYLLGEPSAWPSTTGVQRPVILGKFVGSPI